MKTVKVRVSTNVYGSECLDEFQVDDDATPEEIEETAKDAAFNMMGGSYEVEGAE